MDKRQAEYLMTKIKKGDEEAFAQLYELTAKGVFSFVYDICRNRATAEDMTQETFLRVKRSCQSYKSGTNPTAWILQIAKNITITELKKASKIVYTNYEDTARYGSYTIDEVEPTPLIDTIYKVLDKDAAQIVILHLVNELKHREIAQLLDKPLGTVLWSYNNSIAKLKSALKKEAL